MPDRSEITALFDAWNAALAAGDPARVAALYAEDAILLPTISNKVRRGPEEIRDYFETFLALSPRGRISESEARVLSEDSATHSGLYVFEVTTDGKRIEVPARFTFIYQRGPDGWKILEHHSSGMPEQSAA